MPGTTHLRPSLLLSLVLVLAACRPEGAGYPVGGDLGRARTDMARRPDLGGDPGPRPARGDVGPAGCAVDRLYFGFTGDTRPSDPDDTAGYPVATIDSIFDRLAEA